MPFLTNFSKSFEVILIFLENATNILSWEVTNVIAKHFISYKLFDSFHNFKNPDINYSKLIFLDN